MFLIRSKITNEEVLLNIHRWEVHCVAVVEWDFVEASCETALVDGEVDWWLLLWHKVDV